MNPHRFSDIAHSRHLFYAPLDMGKVDELIGLLDLVPGARVFDAGCGRGELLIRVVQRYSAQGFGVDISPHAVAKALSEAAERVPWAITHFQEADIASIEVEPRSLDLAICVGSTHIYGGYLPALRALSAMVRPGGLVLVGEMYWRIEPDPRFLEMFGMKREEYGDYAETVMLAIQEGLSPIYCSASSEDDWDRYEWLYRYSVERYIAEHPDDPDLAAIVERERLGLQLYVLGRDTNGFMLLLLKVPGGD